MHFIDRKQEFSQLQEALSRKGAELILLYGRRRIGKSRLLHEVGKKHGFGLHVMLEDTDYTSNLAKASAAAAKKWNFPSFAPKSFRDLFESLPQGCSVVLDEFSYLGNAAGEFQGIWEEIAKPKGMKLVLAGSLIRTMEDLNFSLKSPLYGRATKVIRLMPLGLKDVVSWYSGEDFEAVLETYFAVGGIPRYLEIIKKPSRTALKGEFLSQNGMLLREGKLLLKESFPSSPVMPKIMFAISEGKTEASKIANASGIKANEAGKYLSILCEYGFVEKSYPVLGGGKKDVRFAMSDRFFSFWSRFAWLMYGEIESGHSTTAEKSFDANFSGFCGPAFEKAAIEAIRASPSSLSFALSSIGRQWGRMPAKLAHDARNDQYEIDIIASDEKGTHALFAECKWQEKVDAEKILRNLSEKIEYVPPNDGKREEILAVFAKSFSSRANEFEGRKALCFDLTDIAKMLG